MNRFKHIITTFLAATKRWPVFWLVLSAVYVLTINLAEFWGMPTGDFSGFMAAFVQWCVVACVSTGVIGLISINRIVFAGLFPLLAVISIVEVFFYHTLGTGITGTTLEIVFNNNLTMWETVITLPLILLCILSLGIAVAIVVYRWRKVELRWRKEWWMIAICLILTLLPFMFHRLWTPVCSRMPFALYNGFQEYVENRREMEENRTTYNNVEVEVAEEMPDVVFIVGESLRPDHLGLNGYERNTTPLLGAESNLVNFKAARSTGTHTHSSLPYVFTEADSTDMQWGYEQQSFITLFKKAGYATAWIANQDIGKSYSYFAHEPDTLINVNSTRSPYSYGKWLDSDILPFYDRWMSGHKTKPVLTILHTIGSHWWYKSHYVEKDALYLPDMDSKQIGSMSRQQIINSYDNSILATDKFISEIIDRNRDRNAIVIYVSDHGESLGEDGVWLHATEAPELHEVAMFVWYSDSYSGKYPEKVKTIEQMSTRKFSTDDFFDFILETASIRPKSKIKDKK